MSQELKDLLIEFEWFNKALEATVTFESRKKILAKISILSAEIEEEIEKML